MSLRTWTYTMWERIDKSLFWINNIFSEKSKKTQSTSIFLLLLGEENLGHRLSRQLYGNTYKTRNQKFCILNGELPKLSENCIREKTSSSLPRSSGIWLWCYWAIDQQSHNGKPNSYLSILLYCLHTSDLIRAIYESKFGRSEVKYLVNLWIH